MCIFCIGWAEFEEEKHKGTADGLVIEILCWPTPLYFFVVYYFQLQ